MKESHGKLSELLDAGKKALEAAKGASRPALSAIILSIAAAASTTAGCGVDTGNLFCEDKCNDATGGTAGASTGGKGGEAGASVGGSGGTGGSHEGGAGSGATGATGGMGGSGGSIEVDVSGTNSTLELVSPTPAEINDENVGVEGNGTAAGLFVATIRDVNGDVVPNRVVSLDETNGAGTPYIDAVDCVTEVSLGNVPANESVSDANGEACFKASHTTLGINTFAAKEKSSNPEVDIANDVDLAFCNQLDILSPQHNNKLYTDAPTCNDSLGLELNPHNYCILPPFVVTINTSDFADKHAAIFYSTKPMSEIRFRSLGTTSAVGDGPHFTSCTNPLGGANNQPAGANMLSAPDYKYQYPGSLDPANDLGAMIYMEQQ